MDILFLTLLFAAAEGYAFSSIWLTKKINNFTENQETNEIPHRWWPEQKTRKPKSLCLTPECKTAADSLLRNMNISADPCEDFYEFACGGWSKSNPMPATEASWGQFDVVSDKNLHEIQDILESNVDGTEPSPVTAIKTMYQACVKKDLSDSNKLNVKPLLEFMSSFGGGWPLIYGRRWTEEKFHWPDVSSDIIANLYIPSIIAVFVTNDRKNTSYYRLTVDQPSFLLPRDMLIKPTAYKKQIESYKTYIAETAWVLAKAAGSSEVTKTSILLETEDMLDFEMKLANLVSSQEMRRNVLRTYNPMTLLELQEWSDSATPKQIDWLKFIKRLSMNFKMTFNWSEKLIVREMDYIFKCLQHIQNTPPRVVANYMLWGVARHFTRDLTTKTRQLSFEFERVLSGVQSTRPRWKECIEIVYSSMDMALGYSYVQKHFDNSAKLAALQMTDNIKSVFSEELGRLEWMDDETRNKARHKVNAMASHIGYPAWFINATALESYYELMSVSEDHFNNQLASSRFKFLKNFQRLRRSVDRNEWVVSPAEINAFFNPSQNTITFPAAILQPPFFFKGRPEALNYGGIGVIIGHEITHAFDDIGRQFDAEGNLAQWWSENTIETYLKKSQCFVSQYGSYRVTDLDGMTSFETKVNGATTVGENIADNGGLHSALAAYRKHVAKEGEEPGLPGLESYTSEQLFFIAFANNWCETSTKEYLLDTVLTDSHSPHRYRVIGTVHNSEDFPKIFNCPTKRNELCKMCFECVLKTFTVAGGKAVKTKG